jgi:hypothetical protein
MLPNNLFTVSIAADSARPFRRNGFDYVALASGTEYAIDLHNHHDARCDVELYVDGEKVGSFVVQARNTVRIERPSDARRKFTFFGENSQVARSTGAVVGADSNGLVTAIFKPAKSCQSCSGIAYVTRDDLEPVSIIRARGVSPPRSPMRSTLLSNLPSSTNESATPKAMSAAAYRSPSPSYESGVTVLGDYSRQSFNRVSSLSESEIDWRLTTEVSVRLVVDNERRYVPLSHYPPRLDY